MIDKWEMIHSLYREKKKLQFCCLSHLITHNFLWSVTRKCSFSCLWWRGSTFSKAPVNIWGIWCISFTKSCSLSSPQTLSSKLTHFRLLKSLPSIDTVILQVFYENDVVQPALIITVSSFASCGYLPGHMYNGVTAETYYFWCQPLHTICMHGLYHLWEVSSLESCISEMFLLFPVVPVLTFNLFSFSFAFWCL